MNFSRKISSSIIILTVFYGLIVLPIILYWIPLAWYAISYSLEQDGRITFEEIIPFVSLLSMLGGLAVTSGLLYYIIIRVVRPIKSAAAFAESISSGEQPPPLKLPKGNNEVFMLYSSLNLLRDRQQNLTTRLKNSLARESEIRGRIERHESLQLQILNRMLPELRQPLNSIKGFGELAEMKCLNPPGGGEELQKLGRRVGEMARQIERLIDISRLERSRWTSPQLEAFDTADFLRELVNVSAFTLQEHMLTLVNHFSASAPARLCMDRELLLQLLNILIRVVVRGSGEGETVMVSCFRERGEVYFEMRDTRKAEARENIAELYNRYVGRQAELTPENAKIVSLSVIGLLFVRDAVQKLGGKLQVLSNSESHAVIRLEFNEADCVSKDSQWSHASWNENAGSRSWTLPGTGDDDRKTENSDSEAGRPIRVLVLDDSPDDVLIFNGLLGSKRLSIEAVPKLEDFRKRWKTESFDGFIVSDCFGRDRLLEQVEALRASGSRSRPIIVISRAIPDDVHRDLCEMHRVFCMTKPLNFKLLGTLLQTVK